MPKQINYKRNNIAVPRPKIPGQLNFSSKQNDKYQCTICSTTFKFRSKFEEHMKAAHKVAVFSGEAQSTCNIFLASSDVSEMDQCVNWECNDAPGFSESSSQFPGEEQSQDDTGSDEDPIDFQDSGDDESEDENLNPLFNRIIHEMSSNNPQVDLLDIPLNSRGQDCFPFPDLESMILHAFVDGDNDMISRRMLKKIHFTIEMLLKIRSGQQFKKLPSVNSLLRYEKNEKNKIPSFPSEMTSIALAEEKELNVCVNLPSKHLQLLFANPRKCSTIFSLPDYTPNVRNCLQQGEKWREHRLFQQPMWTINNNDYWCGDLVSLAYKPHEWTTGFLLESFHSNSGKIFAKGYELCTSYFDNSSTAYTAVNSEHSTVPIETIVGLYRPNPPPYAFYSLEANNMKLVPLMEKHSSLMSLHTNHPQKKPKAPVSLGCQPAYYKVRIAPIILFTDDTSGNRSKQYNAYESWSMKCAAQSFSERMSISNTHFIAALPKKDGASGTSLLPLIVKDLKMLEDGILMYSSVEKEHVLVVAPLLWIEADTPCHSELCGILGSTTTYPCRKCYFCNGKSRGIPPLRPLNHYTDTVTKRTKGHYQLAASTENRSSVIVDIPLLGHGLEASSLSFTNKKTDSLLELESFDPSKDTPVEVLHCILLGIVKYVITDLVKKVLARKKEVINKLQRSIQKYNTESKLSRKFTKKLQHCGSFLGRDFKILIQCLPAILENEFSDDAALKPVINHFIQLGRLCSLIFVKEINSDLEVYIQRVDASVKDLIIALHDYDRTTTIEKHNPYCRKLKVHLLTHITEDIRRFGTVLNYETEKGEQFNKHIREHLCFTNRKDTAVHVGLKFAKQAILQHVLDGGYWKPLNGHQFVCAGNKIIEFVKVNQKNFDQNLLGGSREFTDNNSTSNESSELQSGISVFFSHDNHQAIIGDMKEGLIIPFYCFNYQQRDQPFILIRQQQQSAASINDFKFGFSLDALRRPSSTDDAQEYLLNLCKFRSLINFPFSKISFSNL